MIRRIIFLLFLILILTTFKTVYNVSAHPGNVSPDGKHYCRTRCDYWGEEWYKRHGHGDEDTGNDYTGVIVFLIVCGIIVYYYGKENDWWGNNI